MKMKHKRKPLRLKEEGNYDPGSGGKMVGGGGGEEEQDYAEIRCGNAPVPISSLGGNVLRSIERRRERRGARERKSTQV